MSPQNKKALIIIASFIIMFLIGAPAILWLSFTFPEYTGTDKWTGWLIIFGPIAITGPGSNVLLKKIFYTQADREFFESQEKAKKK